MVQRRALRKRASDNTKAWEVAGMMVGLGMRRWDKLSEEQSSLLEVQELQIPQDCEYGTVGY